ncbi:MAG TPA: DUF2243 domain-containing protein [Candidatus Binatia bacterium]|nr:DUF2243 domain-containing protein [Candidatus Binatia bacterium]
MHDSQRPVVSAGVVLGAGLGGFFDGILFHQLLQVHNMLTGRIPKDTIANVEIQMFWDGMFHAATWLLTVAGMWMLFRAARRRDVHATGKTLLGGLATGWGLFNFVEGLIDHHLLHLHHVVERLGVSIFDWAFLASGVALIAAGWSMIRSEAGSAAQRAGTR